MKKEVKNVNGITLIALLITVIIILILSSVAIYSGKSIISSSKLTKFTAEMKIMQMQVNDLYDKYKNGDNAILELGEDLSSNEQENTAFSCAGIIDTKDYRFFSQTTIESLNIEGVDGEFLINVEKRSVVSYEGLNYDGEMYYTLEQLPKSLYNVEFQSNIGLPVITKINREKITNDKCRIEIAKIDYTDGNIEKWQAKYRLIGEENWNTSEDLSFVVNKQGTYEIYIENGEIKSDITDITKGITGTTVTTDEWIQIDDAKIANGIKYARNDKYEIEMDIGDYINYNHTDGVDETKTTYTSKTVDNGYGDQVFNISSYTKGWRVLGVEKGQLLLISEDIIGPDSGGFEDATNGNKFYLGGQNGYEKGIDEINKISRIYGQGKYAKYARSVTVEDINKITGYNPNCVGAKNPDDNDIASGTKYGEGQLYEYGNRITYWWQGTNRPYYNATNQKNGIIGAEHETFNWFDELSKTWKKVEKSTTATEEKKEEITTLESNYYYYYPETLNTDPDEGSDKKSEIMYKILFENTWKQYYWLATQFVNTYEGDIGFGVRMIHSGYVRGNRMFNSNGTTYSNYDGIRPIVYLKENLQLTDGGTTSEGNKIWNISE